MVIVYCPQCNDRLSYILDEIFIHRLGVDYSATSDPEHFQNSDAPYKVNYSHQNLLGIAVPNSGFLDSEGILPSFKPAEGRIDFQPVLFPNDYGLGFDIFAMAFWCLSRYEEYQPFTPDIHGRFDSKNSLFYQNGFLEAPVLDIALNYFYEKTGLLPPDKYAVYPTVDIDIAFKHKGKGLVRWVLGMGKFLVGGDFKLLSERLSVFFGKKDPWDTFEYLNEILDLHKGRTRIFVHCGRLAKHDKPVSLKNKKFNKILAQFANKFSLGIHPGYAMGRSLEGILEEKNKLEKALQISVNRSRHHFLRIQIPETYRNLIEAGIVHDYSMGFADSPGFRAGTGHSFRFYDLLNEKATKLVVHPFCGMDVTFKDYLGLSPELATEKMGIIKDLCHKYKLPFCFILHNESVSENGAWTGWKNVFETWLK